jgi:hypothetical protein
MEFGNALIQFTICFSFPTLGRNLNIAISMTDILPAILNACESWSLSLREEHRLRVSAKEKVTHLFQSAQLRYHTKLVEIVMTCSLNEAVRSKTMLSLIWVTKTRVRVGEPVH